MGTDSCIVCRSLEPCDPPTPGPSLFHVKPALRQGVGAVPTLAARPAVSRETARGSFAGRKFRSVARLPVPCCRLCGSFSPEGAGPMTWWTWRHAQLVLCSVHSWICSLHVKRLCGPSSRVEGIGGAAATPLPHDQPLTRYPRDVRRPAPTLSAHAFRPKECVSCETPFVVKPYETRTGPTSGSLSGRLRGRGMPDSTDQESFTENIAP